MTVREQADSHDQLIYKLALSEEKPSRPGLFVSYCHENKQEKDKLYKHLGVLELHDYINILIDTRLETGVNLSDVIAKQLGSATIVVMLVTTAYLASTYIRKTELPVIERGYNEGRMSIKPLIARSCPWQAVPLLESILLWPKDGSAIWNPNASPETIEAQLSAFAMEIKDTAVRRR